LLGKLCPEKFIAFTRYSSLREIVEQLSRISGYQEIRTSGKKGRSEEMRRKRTSNTEPACGG